MKYLKLFSESIITSNEIIELGRDGIQKLDISLDTRIPFSDNEFKIISDYFKKYKSVEYDFESRIRIFNSTHSRSTKYLIDKLDDEWFVVTCYANLDFKYYKCDRIDSLLKFFDMDENKII